MVLFAIQFASHLLFYSFHLYRFTSFTWDVVALFFAQCFLRFLFHSFLSPINLDFFFSKTNPCCELLSNCIFTVA